MIHILKELKEILNIKMAVYDSKDQLIEGFDAINPTDSQIQWLTTDTFKIGVEVLSDEEYCYKTILNTINEGVMLASSEGHITFYNTVMGHLENLRPPDVINKKITDIYGISDEHSEHFIVKNSGVPIIDRYQSYHTQTHALINSVASTYPIKRNGEIIATYSIARNVDKLAELLKRTQKQLDGPYVDFTRTMDNNTRYTFDHIITDSTKMEKTIERAKNYAKFGANTIIYGETGVGKELFAQGIHNYNKVTRSQPFVAINCSAIPETLLESMLFGTTKGAYTGAEDKKGLIDEAGLGTLFLDEINSMPLALQGKLLRVIQENVFRRLGGVSPINMRCRIISATNIPPVDCVKSKSLRADLFYRLAVNTLSIPALKDRKGDIMPLSNHFIKLYSSKYGLKDLTLSADAKSALLSYDYLGNVRELENIIESTITQVNESQIIEGHMLPERLKTTSKELATNTDSLKTFLLQAEKEKLLEVLDQNDWNVSKSASHLSISRQNLQYRMKKLSIIKVKSHGKV